jgi:hypothetical protein
MYQDIRMKTYDAPVLPVDQGWARIGLKIPIHRNGSWVLLLV